MPWKNLVIACLFVSSHLAHAQSWMNPWHPINRVIPLSPIAEINPANAKRPVNTEPNYEKVLKIENGAGGITAFTCYVTGEELAKPVPKDQRCTPLGAVTAVQIQAFVDRKTTCGEITGEDAFMMSMLAMLGGAISLPVMMMGPRWSALTIAAAAGGAALAYYWTSTACKSGVNLVVRRLWNSLNEKLPDGYVRYVVPRNEVWTMIDEVFASAAK